jgi:hypothetical protein
MIKYGKLKSVKYSTIFFIIEEDTEIRGDRKICPKSFETKMEGSFTYFLFLGMHRKTGN